MHLTKPALVAASLLWATAFASPINSPAILSTRGLIGGSTTDGNTKDIAGSTAAGNPVGDDNTKSISKSNAVEGAIESFHLDDFAGSLTARDVSKRHHRSNIAHHIHGDNNDADANDAKSDSDIVGALSNTDGLLRSGIVGANGAEKRFVARDNDGTVHDANKAVHDANKIVHNTLHGLLHGILL
ncbi:hypothetical protein ACHAQE_010039 [Botrytis cinerea]